jgi:hypothetical protein
VFDRVKPLAHDACGIAARATKPLDDLDAHFHKLAPCIDGPLG